MSSGLKVIGICVIAVLFSCGKGQEDVPGQPNIILIMADDLGIEAINSYGGESYQTPNLTAMAEDGMQFDYCYSTPLCTPSRVQLMTGKYSFRNYLGFGILRPGETTFAHLMQDLGYGTCIVGKWQLLGNETQRKLVGGRKGMVPSEAGFDEWCLWQVDHRGYRYKDPTVSIKGQGVDTFPGAYGPDLFATYLHDYIDSMHHRDQPFFAYFPMVLTHDPFQPTPQDSLFEVYDRDIHGNQDTAWFRSMVSYMDQIVGNINSQLDNLGIADNTLVMFIGDNGTDRDIVSSWQGQRIRGEKGFPVEGGTHVPMICRWEGHIEPGSNNSRLVDFTDFLPTIMEVADAELPDDFIADGLSFYGQLIGAYDAPQRTSIFCDYRPAWGKFDHCIYAQDREWKLYDDGRFYHFAQDRFEENPISPADLDLEGQEAHEALLRVISNYKGQMMDAE